VQPFSKVAANASCLSAFGIWNWNWNRNFNWNSQGKRRNRAKDRIGEDPKPGSSGIIRSGTEG